MKAVVLSLPEDAYRREALLPRLDALGINYTVVDGIRVKSLQAVLPEECNALEAYHSDAVRNNPDYVLPVVGARRATLRALDVAADIVGTDPWILMLEDDAELPAEQEDWDDVVSRLQYVKPECGAVLLWRHRVNLGAADRHGIVTLSKYARGLVAYFLRASYIKHVADTIEQSGKEADCVWETLIAGGEAVCQIDCVETTQSQSNIILNIPELKHLAV